MSKRSSVGGFRPGSRLRGFKAIGLATILALLLSSSLLSCGQAAVNQAPRGHKIVTPRPGDKAAELPATFASSKTGVVAIKEVFGNTPDPFSAKRLTITLLHSSDANTFVRLMNARSTLHRVILSSPRDGMRFVLRDVTIIGKRSAACVSPCYRGAPILIMLQVAHLSLKCGPPTCD